MLNIFNNWYANQSTSTDDKSFQLNIFCTQTKEKQIIHIKKKWSMDMIKSAWEQNFEQLLYQLDSDTKKLARKLKKKQNKIIKKGKFQTWSKQ